MSARDTGLATAIARELVPIDLYKAYCHLDAKLVAAGWPATSAWWKEQLRRFWSREPNRHERRRFIANVGRRGGKSSTMCRVCVVELVWGSRHIPPGDVGVFCLMSVKMEEAEARIATIGQILDVLGVPHEQLATEIKVPAENVVVRVYPSNARLSVGFTCIGMLADEVSRWRDDRTGQNPATEVLASVHPSMIDQPHAHEYMISSPWSTADAFWRAVEDGDTEHQMVCSAPTWVARPDLTEEMTHAEEPDLPTWEREYGANPMAATEERMFSADLLAMCVDHHELPRAPQPGDRVVAGADLGFARNATALVVCHVSSLGCYHVAHILCRTPTAGHPLIPSEVCEEIAETMKANGASVVMADVHYRETLDEHLRRHGLFQVPAPVDVASQYVRLRTLAAQGFLKLPSDESLIRDLGEVRSVPRAGGGLRIVLPKRAGGAHSDVVAALALATYQLEGPAATVAPKPAARHPEEQKLMDQVNARLARAQNPGMWRGYGWREGR